MKYLEAKPNVLEKFFFISTMPMCASPFQDWTFCLASSYESILLPLMNCDTDVPHVLTWKTEHNKQFSVLEDNANDLLDENVSGIVPQGNEALQLGRLLRAGKWLGACAELSQSGDVACVKYLRQALNCIQALLPDAESHFAKAHYSELLKCKLFLPESLLWKQCGEVIDGCASDVKLLQASLSVKGGAPPLDKCDFASMDQKALSSVVAWKLAEDAVSKAIAFADDYADELLRRQVTFAQLVHKFFVSLAIAEMRRLMINASQGPIYGHPWMILAQRAP